MLQIKFFFPIYVSMSGGSAGSATFYWRAQGGDQVSEAGRQFVHELR